MVCIQARQYGIPLEGLFDKRVAELTVNTYRSLFKGIPRTWYHLDRLLKDHINNPSETQVAEWGFCIFKRGTIVLPNKMTLRYKVGDESLWGGKILENVVQALARIVIMQAALRLAQRGLRFALQSHDELVFVVPTEQVEAAKKTISDEMTKTPEWLPGLPVAVEIGIGDNYGDCK
jgi:hypothetical protein